MSQPLVESEFPELELKHRGKVRDIYDMGETLLMVTTDRISAFDVILPNPIPDKGKILTQISLFWFDIMAPLVPNHVLTSDVEKYPAPCRPYAEALRGRSMLVKKADPLPVECVVRGYITGSGWKDYLATGQVCGIDLPPGLKESEKLSEPLFTPSTKAALGDHDENIDYAAVVETIGAPMARQIRDLSLAIYARGSELADEKGIIIADTKFEFGLVDGELTLIDEVLTPDSSRFWPRSEYRAGGPQKSFDKQYLRDHLLTLDWDKTPPGPDLPDNLIQNTRAKYLEALKLLTGSANGI